VQDHELIALENRLGVCSPLVVRKLNRVWARAQHLDDSADLVPDQSLLWKVNCKSYDIEQLNIAVHRLYPEQICASLSI
jgi:hypothetical protein